jgi:type VI secretion system secreted protein VgrG
MARVIEITTPLEKDVLLFHTMRGTEELGRLFGYELVLYSLNGEINLDELLGKSITIALERADEGVRYFNGLCSRISQGGREGRYHVYYATVRPWLWFLTRTRNYRIFQEKSVPDILKEMFDHHAGIANVKFELTESYAPWTYCVQYNESDFAFVSRLMEHEGIFYFFKHEDGKHQLILADSNSAYVDAYDEEIPFIPPQERARPEQEHVNEWSISRELQPGKYALTAYDFEKPSVDLQVRSNIEREHALAEYEFFEFGGDFVDRGDGELYARTRIEEEQSKYERTRGATNARAMAPGYQFKLGLHPRADQNTEYVVVSAEYELQSGEYEGRDTTAAAYSCKFTALNSQQPFRTERITPKPVVQGPQTALVVGPAGEEIYTDNYGRIKVHFYWDRYDKRDDKSSCWIRVSQNWGGKGWGGMFIPHVGQEVIVMFEGGDPDLPLITGRVYNAENMPPVALPGGKTQSIIRDHGANEIIMEGAAGKQQMRLFSPTHNTWCHLGNSITWNSTSYWDVTIGGYEYVRITGDSTRDIGQRAHEKVGEKYIHDVKSGYTLNVTAGSFQETVKGNYTTKVTGGNMKVHVTAGEYDMETSGNIRIHAGGTYKRTAVNKEMEINNQVSIKFNKASAHDITLIAKTTTIGGLKAEAVVGGELKKVGPYKSEFVGGWKREMIAGPRYCTATQIENKAVNFKWTGALAKLGTSLKILL